MSDEKIWLLGMLVVAIFSYVVGLSTGLQIGKDRE